MTTTAVKTTTPSTPKTITITEKQRLVYLGLCSRLNDLKTTPINLINERIGELKFELMRFHEMMKWEYDIEDYFTGMKGVVKK